MPRKTHINNAMYQKKFLTNPENMEKHKLWMKEYYAKNREKLNEKALQRYYEKVKIIGNQRFMYL